MEFRMDLQVFKFESNFKMTMKNGFTKIYKRMDLQDFKN